MSWWRSSKAESRRRVEEARKALETTGDEIVEARAIRVDAEKTAISFQQRAISLREIRRANHITPSMFPERNYP